MAGQVLVERRGAVALLTLDNPGKRNALDPTLLGGLAATIDACVGDAVRAAVLTGQGPAFSSGYDIAALPAAPDDTWLAEHGPMGPALRALGRLPVVAALNGPAIGGGCEIALACDLRVAHAGAALQMPPVRMGLVYTPEGMARLVSLCGEARARELLLCARPVLAEEALGWGLLNRVVPPEEVLPTALALAEEIAQGAPLATAGTKWLLEQLLRHGPALPQAVAEEALRRRREAWGSADAAEARAAFRERRAPVFRGR